VADGRDPLEPTRMEIDLEPTAARRLARWIERGRLLRGHVEAARSRHSSVDLGFVLVERDSAIGGGLLAGALAYRLFVLLLPTALLLVSGLGIVAGTVDESPAKVAKDAGLHGLIASEVASAASGRHRALVFVLTLPVVAYATVTLYRAVAKVHALAWYGSARRVRIAPKGVVVFAAVLVLDIVAAWVVGWIRRGDEFGGIAMLLVYLVLVGGSWLAVSTQLPHRSVRWHAFLPGAVVVGAGMLFVNVFNVYVTTRLVESRGHTYGALGIAAALLFSLVLVGRLIVVSAELNAALAERAHEGERDA
jgi:membrane protein